MQLEFCAPIWVSRLSSLSLYFLSVALSTNSREKQWVQRSVCYDFAKVQVFCSVALSLSQRKRLSSARMSWRETGRHFDQRLSCITRNSLLAEEARQAICDSACLPTLIELSSRGQSHTASASIPLAYSPRLQRWLSCQIESKGGYFS